MRRICYILFMIAAGILLMSCGEPVVTLQPEFAPATQKAPPDVTEPPGTDSENDAAHVEPALLILEVHPRFEYLLHSNPDVVGQIIIEGANINYPVLFRGDNTHYLAHDIYGEPSQYGAIFMDMSNRGAILDDNTLLHGNNIPGSMFGGLEYFKDQEFFDANRRVIFNNLYSDMEWEIFAVYAVHTSDYHVLVSFGGYEGYLEFLEHIRARALFFADFEPQPGDRMLTLHTRSAGGAHTLIHARLISKTDNMRD